jgi:hypothetical protein
MTPLQNGWTNVGGAEPLMQYRLNADRSMVDLFGSLRTPPSGNYDRQTIFTFPPGYRPARSISFPIVPNFGAPGQYPDDGFPRSWIPADGNMQFVGLLQGRNNIGPLRVTASFPVPNDDIPFVPQAAEEDEIAQPMTLDPINRKRGPV